ncbi:MAG: sigma-54-dependent transcriptional regulator [Devosia sp.]
MTRGNIAFVDDEPQLRVAAQDWLSASDFTVTTFASARSAIEQVDPHACDCVVTDLRMPGQTGFDVLAHFKDMAPDLPVILLTGHGDVPLSVKAMRTGAYDFIEKPYDADILVAVIDRAVERRQLKRELSRLNSAADQGRMDETLIGASAGMVDLRRSISQLANIDVDVLITGETGTGKELVARALHDFGHRSGGNFVAINCAAIPESIFESEIFGHAKGAFSGAVADRTGKLEFATGGTVFLDEIESMPLALQAKVLRAIQERAVAPLGANGERPIDVRFVAATKVDLRQEGEAGRFRADLYYRLATVEVAIPPLAARREDIPLLFGVFYHAAAQRFGVEAQLPDEASLDAMCEAAWPGNVRELKAAAERAALGIASPNHGPSATGTGLTLPDRVARFEAGVIVQALRATNGSTAEAAERLGVPRRTLNEKITRHGLRASVGADEDDNG